MASTPVCHTGDEGSIPFYPSINQKGVIMIQGYVSIPQKVEAMQWIKLDNNNWREACDFAGRYNIGSNGLGVMTLWTHEGPRMLENNSYIVKDNKGFIHYYSEKDFKEKFTSARGVMDSMRLS